MGTKEESRLIMRSRVLCQMAVLVYLDSIRGNELEVLQVKQMSYCGAEMLEDALEKAYTAKMRRDLTWDKKLQDNVEHFKAAFSLLAARERKQQERERKKQEKSCQP